MRRPRAVAASSSPLGEKDEPGEPWWNTTTGPSTAPATTYSSARPSRSVVSRRSGPPFAICTSRSDVRPLRAPPRASLVVADEHEGHLRQLDRLIARERHDD